MVKLKIVGSATHADLGFYLKVVTESGALFELATDEAHARRIIRGYQDLLERNPRYQR
jgi:hypothetical protein